MKLSTVDIVIVAVYIVLVILMGFLMKKQASKNIKSYFLGGNKLPWYMLGLSNASGMFDISGTMWMVMLMFVLGVKSVWIPWLWPVFNQIILMIYLSAWLRRSNVLTGAEWIRTRFGNGVGAHLSHFVVVAFAILSALGFLSYGFIGVGKFIEAFIPWNSVEHIMPEFITQANAATYYGIAMVAVVTLYVVLGGMMSIVWTDVFQFIIMTICCVAIGIIAMDKVDRPTLMGLVPQGWNELFFGWKLDLDWTTIIPGVNEKLEKEGFTLFGAFFMMMLFKGIFASMAGPAPNYDMQKILSTKSPSEAAKMSGLVSLVLLFPRYLMITGFTILAMVFLREEFLAGGDSFDFERVLPLAVNEFIPIGLKGMLIAGLLAAFKSTYASTVNAAPAYLINDIYLKYINPNAERKQLINYSYLISVTMVVLSTLIGLYVMEINTVIQWIVSALYGGYIASNVLKWHWWRFNGHGYFWGMAAGIAASIVFPKFFPDVVPLFYFPLTFGVSLAGCLIGTYAAPPTEDAVLKKFYRTVRPWGFWKPIHDKVVQDDPSFERNKNFKRDMFNVVTGIIWQTCLTVLPVYIIIREQTPMFTTIGILLVTTLILKKNWYDKLADEDVAWQKEKDADEKNADEVPEPANA
jgi:solute:Na+ symporter, SSS family